MFFFPPFVNILSKCTLLSAQISGLSLQCLCWNPDFSFQMFWKTSPSGPTSSKKKKKSNWPVFKLNFHLSFYYNLHGQIPRRRIIARGHVNQFHRQTMLAEVISLEKRRQRLFVVKSGSIHKNSGQFFFLNILMILDCVHAYCCLSFHNTAHFEGFFLSV